jgi:hypothetical protein
MCIPDQPNRCTNYIIVSNAGTVVSLQAFSLSCQVVIRGMWMTTGVRSTGLCVGSRYARRGTNHVYVVANGTTHSKIYINVF